MTNNLTRGVDVDESTQTKACCRCGADKTVSCYYKRTKAQDGLSPACKSCLADDRRLRRAMTDADRATKVQALTTRPTKVCGRCGQEKVRAEFTIRQRVRDGLSAWCRACNAEYGREHYERNASARSEQVKLWYLANKAKRNEQQRAWNRANLVRLREYNAERSQRWREENPERMAELMAAGRLRRMKRLEAATFGSVDLKALWTGVCGICRASMDRALRYSDPMSKSIDHIIPLAKGGAHAQHNLQYAHLECNRMKGARLPD